MLRKKERLRSIADREWNGGVLFFMSIHSGDLPKHDGWEVLTDPETLVVN